MSDSRPAPKPVIKSLACGLVVVTLCAWDGDIRRFADLFFETEQEARVYVAGLIPREVVLRVRAAAWIAAAERVALDGGVPVNLVRRDRYEREALVFHAANAALSEVLL